MPSYLRRFVGVMRAAGKALLAAGDASLTDGEYAFRREVRSRKPMDDETFWTTFYKTSGISFEIAATVRRIYGEQLGHDPMKLRADDFDPALWDIAAIELVMEVQEEFGISISESEAEQTSGTIDSIIRLVARELKDAPRAKVRTESPLTGLAPARRSASSA